MHLLEISNFPIRLHVEDLQGSGLVLLLTYLAEAMVLCLSSEVINGEISYLGHLKRKMGHCFLWPQGYVNRSSRNVM